MAGSTDGLTRTLLLLARETMEQKEIITLGIALWGAILGTYGAVLATGTLLTQRRDKKPRLRVKGSRGFFGGSRAPDETQVIITAANIGQVPVTIASFGFGLQAGGQLIYPGGVQITNLPKEVSPGQSVSFFVPKNVLLRGLLEHGYHAKVKLTPQGEDQLGNVYRGHAETFDVASAAS
jgi:hypothetical protein